MHDPFQSYPTVGPYAGVTTPSNLPYTALQASLMNPAAAYNPFATTFGQFGMGPATGMTLAGQPFGTPYNIGAQQLQTAAILAAQTGNPQLLGLAGLYNPLQAALLTNPLIAASLQNPYINSGIQNPLLGIGQQNPFQTGLYGNPLLGIGIAANPFLAGIQNPALNPLYAGQNPYQVGQYGLQQYSPYSQLGYLGAQLGQLGQIGSLLGQVGHLGQGHYGQVGYPLAPQSWVGQAGPFGGGQYGQVHPLLQQMRTLQNPGIGSLG